LANGSVLPFYPTPVSLNLHQTMAVDLIRYCLTSNHYIAYKRTERWNI